VRGGGVVAHATEGVWGLACDPTHRGAIEHILWLKQRAPTRGLIVVGATASILKPWVAENAQDAWASALETWPGPTTWLLPAAPGIDNYLTGGGAQIALRVTAHPSSHALAATAGGAIVSTSANPSARPAAIHGWQVRRYFGRQIDFVLGGHCANPGTPSTIRDATTGQTIRGKSNG